METRKKIIADLQEFLSQVQCPNDDETCKFCTKQRETLRAAIYELECSGIPADGVWYVEQRGSSRR
jgi:hypothetical protein